MKNSLFVKPFLRWAGGKNWLVKHISNLVPDDFNDYHEPFLGGGAIFFNMPIKKKVYLSDSIPDLINAYIQVRDNLEMILLCLSNFRNTKKDYYEIRSRKYNDPTMQAAQFIYMNRTCFNGIYRVNYKGDFNVPYGFKKYKILFDHNQFRKASNLLKNTEIFTSDFEGTLKNIREKDFVFLDPPYNITTVKNGFIKYNEKLFSRDDQIRLASYLKKINKRGAYYLLTNANHPFVRELFKNEGKIFSIERSSVIGGKKALRGQISELIFSNIS
ncbi:MAG: Dam family site-specific DNA-(adenine-N6)-methyltransferase [Candidatus Aminicenantes bacterium]|nr:Dam family site-specific DNA-(adenine-N6)-methyltransferase [Candidatus Aminicenantes bacterium]